MHAHISSLGLFWIRLMIVLGCAGLSTSRAQIILSEVLYNAVGTDASLEWVELYNLGSDPVDLSNWSLAFAGLNYTAFQLSGVIPPRSTFVIGGPLSNDHNANPSIDFNFEFGSGIQNGGQTADVVALYEAVAASITVGTVPDDAVIYGDVNSNGLLDESGVANHPDVGNAGSGESVERLDFYGAWQVQAMPTPNEVPFRVRLLISEVLYDVNGPDDGYEWVELFNPNPFPVDLSGWTLGYGGGDYTVGMQALSGVIPPGHVFVTGGAISDSDNGNPVYDVIVPFTNQLQNAGAVADGVALFDKPVAQITPLLLPIDAVVYGDINSSNLIDENGIAGPPDVGDAPGGQSIERLDRVGAWQVQASPSPNRSPLVVRLLLSEVLYDLVGSDANDEWVELYNPNTFPVDLANWSLGYGGGDYTVGVQQLSGTIQPGRVFVLGGGNSDVDNGNPVYDLNLPFTTQLQNGGTTADGIALFNKPAAQITSTLIPIDAVVYGDANDNNLIDESGFAGLPDVGDAPSGQSIERIDLDGNWQIQATPTPNRSALEVRILLSEVLYNVSGSDANAEWVELYNPNRFAVDLSRWSLGYGGGDYVVGTYQLTGRIPAGGVRVVGGPLETVANGSPDIDQPVAFNPQLQNSGVTADGMALFNRPANQITASLVPMDAVVYGQDNTSSLIDETGVANAPEVGDAGGSGPSIERIDLAGNWQIQAVPTPNGSASLSKAFPATTLDLLIDAVQVDGSSVKIQVDLAEAEAVKVELCYAVDVQTPSWVAISRHTLAPGASTLVVDLAAMGLPSGGVFAIIRVD